jgi:hypothetical protein
MALYDREYYRGDESQRSFDFRGMTAINQVLIVNIVLFVLNFLFTHNENTITQALTLQPDDLARPWMWWRLLSYGFVHSPENLFHILMNMFVLWMFGREMEAIYGRSEFLRIYLVSIVLGGLMWVSPSKCHGSDRFRVARRLRWCYHHFPPVRLPLPAPDHPADVHPGPRLVGRPPVRPQ